MLRGGWYTRLGYGCLIGGGGRKLSAWTVRSSHIGCSERAGQLLPGLPVNSASWTSVWTKPACVLLLQQRGEQCSQAVTCSHLVFLCATASSSYEILLLCQTQTPCHGAELRLQLGLRHAVLSSSSYILMMILSYTDLFDLLRAPKDTVPSCNLLGVVMWEKGFWRELRGSRLG